jgi:hypothetical protein
LVVIPAIDLDGIAKLFFDRQYDLIKMPFVACSGSIPPDASGEMSTKPVYPQPNRLAADNHPALGKQIFDIRSAERKPMICPHGIGDNLSGKAKALQARLYRCCLHDDRLSASISRSTWQCRRLLFGIFASLAEFKSELIRERTMAGLAAARARGRKGGRKFALTKAQVRMAQAAMAHRDTSISELKIRPVTLYRYVGPEGNLRKNGKRLLGARHSMVFREIWKT